MAKKKSKKGMSITKLVIIALAVLTICTLFMPVISRKGSLLGGDSKTIYSIYGKDVFAGLFSSQSNLEYSEGANALIALKNIDGSAFVTNLFMILYLLTIAVSVAIVVFGVLSILGMKFKMINTVLGSCLVVLAIATFIFAILVSNKMASVDAGSIAETKGVIAIGTYLLISTLICGGAHAYDARK